MEESGNSLILVVELTKVVQIKLQLTITVTLQHPSTKFRHKALMLCVKNADVYFDYTNLQSTYTMASVPSLANTVNTVFQGIRQLTQCGTVSVSISKYLLYSQYHTFKHLKMKPTFSFTVHLQKLANHLLKYVTHSF